MPKAFTREAAIALDRGDLLAPLRQRFALPENLRYFDGNSLGPLLHACRERASDTLERQWGQDLITSWNTHGWIDLPRRVGAKIAPLIGAREEEVVVADSTSVNLFKLLATGLELRPDRHVILSEKSQFPTDLYMAQGLAELRRDLEPRLVDGDVTENLDADVAVACLSHVDFKTGELRDMAAINKSVHACGAVVLWDLSHSAGALEIDLETHATDLAVGCTYKFLNGGPGSPAYLYVARRHLDKVKGPLWGWLGHRDPFAFETSYQPAPGIDRFQCGTPPILSMAVLDTALDLFSEVNVEDVRRKSMALGDLFLDLVTHFTDLEIVSPRIATQRGSQVSLAHREGYSIIQALIERGTLGDFRAPNILRFGICPLFQRFVDVWDAVQDLHQVLRSNAWDDPRFQRRSTVT